MENFQLVSDIHLELYKDELTNSEIKNILIPSAKNLLLCGDIGKPNTPKKSYEIFIKYCSENFEHVFLITGNHEYYRSKINDDKLLDIQEIDNLIANIVAQFPNVHFLNNSYYILEPDNDNKSDQSNQYDRWCILGTTLWSLVPETHIPLAQRCINDYKLIYKNENISDNDESKFINITPKDTNQLFAKNFQWLKETISKLKDSGMKFIVMTHHLPSFKLVAARHKSSDPATDINCCFASNLDHFILENDDLIKYWCCGHTHTSMNETLGKCRMLINPKGYLLKKSYYISENENSQFNRELTF
jgi:predicted phosphodiesterase